MKENNQNKLIAGIDGSKGGWVCVSSDTNNTKKPKFDIFNKFEEVIERKFDLILVDIPIGLDKKLYKGGRVVDREARGMLLKNKSSIFNSPSRMALNAKEYQEANIINKAHGMGLSKQSWFLFKKIKKSCTTKTALLVLLCVILLFTSIFKKLNDFCVIVFCCHIKWCISSPSSLIYINIFSS